MVKPLSLGSKPRMDCPAVPGRCLFGAVMLLLFFLPSYAFAADRQGERIRMVKEQIEEDGVHHPATLAALRAVPRHKFVPGALTHLAYHDRPLPIGHGQTISQPYIVGYMTEQLQPEPDDTVLEIGTGSGYQAAVLAEIVKQVHTIEIIPELAAAAAKRLAAMDYANVTVRQGDGFWGWKEAAPFDAIIVTAAAEFIPPPLISQLKEDGRMIIPIGSPFGVQWLMMVHKEGGAVRTERLLPVRFVPLTRQKKE